ncbi:MAG: response regulator transcription factor [Planctomycetes bacterium]|nr:response regulator transcription factor [Planctomycetota bacterium]
MARILIVEDDRAIAKGVADVLRLEGFDVLAAADGEAGLRLALGEAVDLVVLDVRLPRLDGFEVCRRIREDRLALPILMLTAKAQEADKVLGLGLGADDYMTKPFGIAELIARVKALLRRALVKPEEAELREVEFGRVRVDFERLRATRAGKDVTLSAREFALLRYLVRRRDCVVTREELLRAVWHYDDPPVTRTVDVHIAQLRRKLGPRHFTSVRAVGYRFEG